ncbi:MAG: transcriptional regulator [Planctomycetes bacterium]|nr:transcriptional regulator [Planctomycetota bacterium]
MDAPAVIYALRWLINDTFRQTLASRVFWILLGLSVLAIVFCLGVSVEGGATRDEGEFWTRDGQPLQGPGSAGRLTLMFGLFQAPFSRDASEPVHLLLSIFASWIAGTLGLLMALVWTAGFLPDALQPGSASVLLAKPAPHWLILLGKYLGVICFVGLHATIFFVGTWLALGLKTDVWQGAYLLGIPILTLHFAVIFSASVLLAVLFRSATACVIGSVLFWLVSYAVNYGRDFALVYAELNPGAPPLPAFTSAFSELGYWLLPKPADFLIVFEQCLELGQVTTTLASQPPFSTVLRTEQFHPLASLASSALFPVVALWAASSHLASQDY